MLFETERGQRIFYSTRRKEKLGLRVLQGFYGEFQVFGFNLRFIELSARFAGRGDLVDEKVSIVKNVYCGYGFSVYSDFKGEISLEGSVLMCIC